MAGCYKMSKKVLLSLVLLMMLSGCDLAAAVHDLASVETELDYQSENGQGLFELEQIDCILDLTAGVTAEVLRVIDGDSIEVEINGETFQVRYIGINTPEHYSDDRERAVEATKANQRLVEDKQVYLFKDHSETDKYGRLLRYVVTDEAFVNLELVRDGYAEAREYRPDTACHAVFENAAE